MSKPLLYKWLGPNRESHHGGIGKWPEPGKWLEVEHELEPCHNGRRLGRRQVRRTPVADTPAYALPAGGVAEMTAELDRLRAEVSGLHARLREIHDRFTSRDRDTKELHYSILSLSVDKQRAALRAVAADPAFASLDEKTQARVLMALGRYEWARGDLHKVMEVIDA